MKNCMFPFRLSSVLSLLLLSITVSCSNGVLDNPGSSSAPGDSSPFSDGVVLTDTNLNGGSLLFTASNTVIIEALTNDEPITDPAVSMDLETSVTNNDDTALWQAASNINEPFSREMALCYQDFRRNIYPSVQGMGPSPVSRPKRNPVEVRGFEGSLDLMISNELALAAIEAGGPEMVTQDAYDAAVKKAMNDYNNWLYNKHKAEVENAQEEENNILNAFLDYLTTDTNSDYPAVVAGSPAARRVSLSGTSYTARLARADLASRETFPSAKSSTRIQAKSPSGIKLSNRTEFEIEFIANARSGDIGIYWDNFLDTLIGGHCFLWNASNRMVLTSGLSENNGSIWPGEAGCKYYSSLNYLNKKEMYHEMVVSNGTKAWNATDFEKQMNDYEARHHLTGYNIQFVRKTITFLGTYCNQVVWMNWKEYNGLDIDSTPLLIINVPITYSERRSMTVGFGRFKSVIYYYFYTIKTIPVQIGPDIATGQDIKNSRYIECQRWCKE